MQEVQQAPREATRAIPQVPLWWGALAYRYPLRIPSRLARKHGDVFFFKFGKDQIFFLTHPDDIRELLVVQHENFRKGDGVMLLGRVLGNGLITNEGASHRKQRRLVQPAFHRQRIASYALAMVDAAEQQARAWQDGAQVDITDEMLRLTLVIVGRTLFNTDIAKEAATFHQGLATSMEAFRKVGLSPWGNLIEQMDFPIIKRLRRARASLDTVVYRIIEEHQRAGNDQGDLLSMLLLARDEEGNPMDTEQLRDEIMTLFMAGHETVAHALTWTWYHLSRNPDVLAKLWQEVDTVLEGRTATFDDLPRLVYTNQVLMEAMRICPPVWAIDRRAVCDTALHGLHIPKGARIVMSQYQVQHDPRFYPDPERFDPERWTPEAQATRSKFAYFPFGGGPRLCIGESFTWTESLLLLATLSQHWEVRLAPHARIKFQPAVTLRPRYGVAMTLHTRSATAL